MLAAPGAQRYLSERCAWKWTCWWFSNSKFSVWRDAGFLSTPARPLTLPPAVCTGSASQAEPHLLFPTFLESRLVGQGGIFGSICFSVVLYGAGPLSCTFRRSFVFPSIAQRPLARSPFWLGSGGGGHFMVHCFLFTLFLL